MWSLATLGSLRLTDATTGGDCLRGRRKELVLLAFLVRRAPRPVPRAVLAELLWGDKDEARARASLRQALSQLRRVLGDALDTRGDAVVLATGAVTFDAMRVEAAAAASRWHEVVAQWNGDFLSGHDELGGEAYLDWLHGERARLARIAERARDAIVAIDAEHVPSEDPATSPTALADAPTQSETTPARRRWRIAPVATGVALLVVAGALAWQLSGGATSEPTVGQQTVLVADFGAVGVDTTLADGVAEAVRVGLRQSRVLSLYPPAAFRDAARRLTPQSARAGLSVARQVAARAGVKAVVDGQVIGVGARYLVSVRLVTAVSGQEVAHYSAEAANQRELLPAIDRLAADLRRGTGESLRSVETARPVERVTTSSLEALAKYVRATRALDQAGAPEEAVALLEEAIALDSSFAMAYRRLAIELNDRRENPARVRDLITRAYALRTRLADPERYAVEAAFYSFGPTPDEDRATAAYQSALESDPRFGVALINLSEIYLRRHEFAHAESLSKRIVSLGTGVIQGHVNLMAAQTSLGDLDGAAATLAHFDSTSPNNPTAAIARARLLFARGKPDSAMLVLRRVFDTSPDLSRKQSVAGMLRDAALARGRIADARAWSQNWMDMASRRGVPAAALAGALDQAWITLWFEGDTSGALQQTAAALRANPLRAIVTGDRPYGRLVRIFAWSGRVAQARMALAGYDSANGRNVRLNARSYGPRYRGEIALAEGKYAEALAGFRTADSTDCPTCLFPLMAVAYDRAGLRDSAVALFARYVQTPEFYRLETDADFLRIALQASRHEDHVIGDRRRR
jgi:tetratricopeptide (TPR) repeat protein